jgi:threonine aldolase
MMFCVFEGLGAPIGSLLCGPAEAIREGRRLKILYGGAWRQAGIMAAAGPGRPRGRPRPPARGPRVRAGSPRGSRRCPGAVDLEQVETNMVYVDTAVIGLRGGRGPRRLASLGVGATHSAGKVRLWSRTSTWTTQGSARRSTRGVRSRAESPEGR